MDKSKSTPRIHVVPDGKRRARRSWSDAEKLTIVQESHQDGIIVAQLARQHGISPSQLYDWRYRHKIGLLGGPHGFSQVVAVSDPVEEPGEEPGARLDLVAEIGGRYRITIPSGYDMGAAVYLLRGLS